MLLMVVVVQDCGFKNSEVQFGGVYGPKGVVWELKVEKPEDMNRQVVKSDFAELLIPELELEMPANNKKGVLTTVEGLLVYAADDLEELQPVRRHTDPEVCSLLLFFISCHIPAPTFVCSFLLLGGSKTRRVH